jgi:hypothetical protein
MSPLLVIASKCVDAYLVSARAKPHKNFIKTAIKKPGAFRASLHKLGILKGDEPVRQHHIDEAIKHSHKTGDKKLARRANLARTLIKLGKRAHKK